jgi:hypothetical protein
MPKKYTVKDTTKVQREKYANDVTQIIFIVLSFLRFWVIL